MFLCDINLSVYMLNEYTRARNTLTSDRIGASFRVYQLRLEGTDRGCYFDKLGPDIRDAHRKKTLESTDIASFDKFRDFGSSYSRKGSWFLD